MTAKTALLLALLALAARANAIEYVSIEPINLKRYANGDLTYQYGYVKKSYPSSNTMETTLLCPILKITTVVDPVIQQQHNPTTHFVPGSSSAISAHQPALDSYGTLMIDRQHIFDEHTIHLISDCRNGPPVLSAKFQIPPSPNKCDLTADHVDLGTMTPDSAGRRTSETIKIRCVRPTTVKITISSDKLEFTAGATTRVNIVPETGLITVGSAGSNVPLVFDTTVSASSEGGSYQNSLVVTSEIQ